MREPEQCYNFGHLFCLCRQFSLCASMYVCVCMHIYTYKHIVIINFIFYDCWYNEKYTNILHQSNFFNLKIFRFYGTTF